MVMHRQVRLDEAVQACSRSARDFESFVEPLVFAEVRGARHLASKKPVSVGVAYWQEPDSGRVHTVMVVAPGGVKRVVEAVDTALTDYLTKLFSQSTASAAQTTFRYGAWQLLSEDVKFVLDTHPSKLVEEDDEEEGGEGEEAPEPDAEEAGQESDLGAEDKEEGPAGWDEQTIRDAAEEAGIDISEFDMDQLVAGMKVELEHGEQDGDTDVTADSPVETLKIVIAHMRELPNYYTLLDDMEGAGKDGATGLEAKDTKESRRRRVVERGPRVGGVPCLFTSLDDVEPDEVASAQEQGAWGTHIWCPDGNATSVAQAIKKIGDKDVLDVMVDEPDTVLLTIKADDDFDAIIKTDDLVSMIGFCAVPESKKYRRRPRTIKEHRERMKNEALRVQGVTKWFDIEVWPEPFDMKELEKARTLLTKKGYQCTPIADAKLIGGSAWFNVRVQSGTEQTAEDLVKSALKSSNLAVEAKRHRWSAKEQYLPHPGESEWGVRLHGGPWVVVVSAKNATEAKELLRTELMTNKTLRDFWRQWEEKGAPVEKVGKADPREVVNRKESFRRHWSRKR